MGKTRTFLMTISIMAVLLNGGYLVDTYRLGVGSGDSMEPVISPCDTIIYENNDFEDAEKGEIIVYEGQGRMVAHEYMGSSVAKGINNEDIDPVAVSESNYRGEVQDVLPTSSVCDIVKV
ncbi:S24/S26 family peptidase [Halorubrum ezzemoulense]|uniref:hypothetical protein n=1 Tax=Halorubrum ezzemoulense TaxID=337243 RepID=UPI0011405A49|nr:hypothetical protein [Halorubrum ezzemoulense]